MSKSSTGLRTIAGFTLIELIVVIVILGILAGVALPRFINQTTNARIAALKGFSGNLAGAVALAQQQYIAEGNSNTSSSVVVTMNGSVVSVLAKTGAPSASSLNSATASPLANYSGFGITVNPTLATINFAPTAVSGCSILYDDGAGTNQPTITVVTTSC